MDKVNAHNVPRRDMVGSLLGFIILGLCLLTLVSCGGDTAVFLPGPLTDLELGGQSADIVKQIGTVGKVTTTPLAKAGRTRVTWTVPVSPYFKRIEMEFTEKDRMYVARFVLKDEGRLDAKTIKQKLFDRYKISWEEPNRFSRDNMDVLVYAPELEGKYILFEITSTTNGEKSLELFATDISRSDRQDPKKEAQSGPGLTEAPGPVAEDSAKPKSESVTKPVEPAPGAEGTALPAPPVSK
jgi:hypothetical protein